MAQVTTKQFLKYRIQKKLEKGMIKVIRKDSKDKDFHSKKLGLGIPYSKTTFFTPNTVLKSQ